MKGIKDYEASSGNSFDPGEPGGCSVFHPYIAGPEYPQQKSQHTNDTIAIHSFMSGNHRTKSSAEEGYNHKTSGRNLKPSEDFQKNFNDPVCFHRTLVLSEQDNKQSG
jgi:hypothetical protein